MNDETKRLAGQREEDRVYEAVSKLPGVKIYRSLYVPYGRAGQTAELDLVLLCSKGIIFTIEVKSYAGQITGSLQRYEWTSFSKPPGAREKKVTKIYSPIRQLRRQQEILGRYLGVSDKHINGLVVFSDRATLKKVPAKSDSGIAVLQTRFVASHIRRCLANRKARFSPTELRRIAQRLDAASNASDVTKRRHIAQAKKAEHARRAEQERRRASRKKK